MAIRVFTSSLFVLLLVPASSSVAQAAGSVYPGAHVMQTARSLEAKLKSGGNLSGVMEERLNESTQVAVRTKDGRAEFHQNAADVFYVLSGEATLQSGGTIIHPQGGDEIRGDAIQGAASATMHKGDVVYVPPATPHQILIKPGTSFLYLVVKVPRKD